MGRIIFAIMMLAACSAQASERWTRVANVDDVSVSVTEVTETELARLRARHERSTDRSALGRSVPMHRYGFSILFRDRESGAFRCEVYVKDRTDTVTLEHELRHCHGWVHD